ncbi:MAG: tetratricopeptide repeat protein [Clostridiaceae bacterium]|nr:tetratricopeptide repeat protein [Clostridiaceae bacterium]
MKKSVLLVALCMLFAMFSGCALEIPSISHAREVVQAYVHYNRTGELPQNIMQILKRNTGSSQSDFLQEIESSGGTLEETLRQSTKSELLQMARKYYEKAYPFIEADTGDEYNRLIKWEPDFSGKTPTSEDIEIQELSSVNVALALSYTNAKNFYLAMAASVFALNPEDTVAAGNFAAALASYADDLQQEGSPAAQTKQYYDDAIKVYHYALTLDGVTGNYSKRALPLLVSLGNLYLDNGKYNEAYACFQAALEIDEEYSTAIEGLYNTYMAMKQHEKALELIEKKAKFFAITRAVVKVTKEKEENEKKPGMKDQSMNEEAVQVKLDSLETIDAVSTADFLDLIDVEAKEKLKKLISEVQGRMVYKAPDITMLSQYSNLAGISSPMGRAALESFNEGLGQLYEEVLKAQEKMEARFPSDDAVDKAISEMQKFRIGPKSDVETIEKYYAALSKIMPEYSIFSINPYDYANPVDIIIQRYNVHYFNTKLNTYNKYLILVNQRVEQNVREIVDASMAADIELFDQMYEKIAQIDPEDERYMEKVHMVHTSYYPKINQTRQTYWNQATSITVTAYEQKIKKYLEQMYNDCMKHLILISDDYIQSYLEEKLRYYMLSNLEHIMDQIYLSFSFTIYDNDCHCNLDALRKERERNEKELAKLANEQILRNMEAKKRFESGELDENSEYYKKIIKPYEVTINSPFVKGKIGPYKTEMHFKVDVPLPEKFKQWSGLIEFSKVENHIRNTTTYNGGIEVGKSFDAGRANIDAKVFFRFTAVKGSDGRFAMDDVDIVGGGEYTLKLLNTVTTSGFEASAVRGPKTYSSFAVSADKLLNSELKKAMGYWAPNLKKELWKGEYPGY